MDVDSIRELIAAFSDLGGEATTINIACDILGRHRLPGDNYGEPDV